MKVFEDLNTSSKIHMIGIGGISMSGIAIMLKSSGFDVSGSDSTESDMTQLLRLNGIPVFIGNDAKNIVGKDIVVYTSAIDKTNDKEYLKAIELSLDVYERAPFLGIIIKSYDRPICVAGMHGKTTTTSMIAASLKGLNANPSVLVGSRLKELGNLNYMIGGKDFFVIEACEYVDSFLNFPGHTSVILNIEEDHLDYFTDIENIKDSFKKFLFLTKSGGNVVIYQDCIYCKKLLEESAKFLKSRNIKIYTFSTIDNTAILFADNIKINVNGLYSFDLYINQSFECVVELSLPGKHNILNALATIGVLYAYGFNIKKSIRILRNFTGASRRFEYKKTINRNVRIYDDYAHHPTEIRTSILTAIEKNPNRVIAVFEPHTYTRTLKLFNEFVRCFKGADLVIITKIYAAREKDNGQINSQMLVDRLISEGINAIYIEDFNDIARHIKLNIEENDIVLTIGAGTVTKISELL